jgi:hypothetical protein
MTICETDKETFNELRRIPMAEAIRISRDTRPGSMTYEELIISQNKRLEGKGWFWKKDDDTGIYSLVKGDNFDD